MITKPNMTVEELLYACILELSYVQSIENCRSGRCASSLGEQLIEMGMERLGVIDLSATELENAPRGQYKAK